MKYQLSNLLKKGMGQDTKKLDALIWKNTSSLVSLFFYLVPLTLGLYLHDHLVKSPLLRFVGKVMAFFLSILTWTVAYLSSGIVLGNFQFPKDVFGLRSRVDFKIAVACFIVCIPLALVAKKTVTSVSSASSRKTVSMISLFAIIATSFLVAEYLDTLANTAPYVFSLGTIGSLYLWLFGKRNRHNVRS